MSFFRKLFGIPELTEEEKRQRLLRSLGIEKVEPLVTYYTKSGKLALMVERTTMLDGHVFYAYGGGVWHDGKIIRREENELVNLSKGVRVMAAMARNYRVEKYEALNTYPEDEHPIYMPYITLKEYNALRKKKGLPPV